MIPFGMVGHHMVGRVPIYSPTQKIQQSLLVCKNHYDYTIRALFEPNPIMQEIHIMKLARELADAFSNDKPLQSWDIFKDKNVVFYVSRPPNDVIGDDLLYVSDTKYDYNWGVVMNTPSLDAYNLSNLICHMLNGQDIDRFLIASDGTVEDCGE